MTILVTGATGLVGARLLPRLVEAGFACRALVRGGKQVPAGVVAVEGDLLDPDTLAPALAGVSAIIHLAAVFRTPDTDLIRKVNVEGTRNLIDAARRYAPHARFILASTGLVYAPAAGRPSREHDAVQPKMAYPASKVDAEKILRESGLNWSIQRFGFVYGDGDAHIAALPRLVETFGWHPAGKLSMIHHQDIATAMRLALSGAFDGRIVNITDDAPTIYELVRIAGEEMKPSNDPLTEPWSGHMDSGLARSLGFRPSVRTVFQSVDSGTL